MASTVTDLKEVMMQPSNGVKVYNNEETTKPKSHPC